MKWCDGVRSITYKAYNTNDGTAKERKKPFDINKKNLKNLSSLQCTLGCLYVYACVSL